MDSLSLTGPKPKLEVLRSAAHSCTLCALSASRTNVVFGEGDPAAALMIVGEAPGEVEDRAAEPFVGRSGLLLSKWLTEMGISRRDIFIHNAVMCRPPGNRTPESAELGACSQHFWDKVVAVDPKIIVTLGKTAAVTVIGDHIANIPMVKLRNGTYRDARTSKMVVVPTYHPSYILRGNQDAEQRTREDFGKALKHLIRLNQYNGVPKAEWAARVLLDAVEEMYGSEE